jgi:hypothetical protein
VEILAHKVRLYLEKVNHEFVFDHFEIYRIEQIEFSLLIISDFPCILIVSNLSIQFFVSVSIVRRIFALEKMIIEFI